VKNHFPFAELTKGPMTPETHIMHTPLRILGLLFALLLPDWLFAGDQPASPTAATTITSLDGQWSLAVDPKNVGREQKWFANNLPEAKSARVPWILQGAFPGYHGVAWYAREFDAPVNPHSGGRYLLRFEQVDYLAEVWVNGAAIGGHEGGETPFVLDATDRIKAGETNYLVVRVLNPTHEPIDGIRLNETARRCKVIPFNAGAAFNHGGITGSVSLQCVPTVYVDDVFAVAEPDTVTLPNATTGKLHMQADVRNASQAAKNGHVEITVASARSGETTAVVRLDREFAAGVSTVDADVTVDHPHLWQLNDPYLYRVTVRAAIDGSGDLSERSTRCGFRDFRFADGYFRLNGRRILLRCCHTCNHYPIGQQFPHDPDLLRRDLLNLKVMGFNAVRFIWGAATPVQLDLCDEMGFMVYEESYASNWIDPSPKMAERFDAGVAEVIRRDRNHPCVVMWGLLNEAQNNAAFQHAVKMLPLVRSLDSTRVVMLNSGRYDAVGGNGATGIVAGLSLWPKGPMTEPWVGINSTTHVIRTLGITWPAGHLAFHPGPKNEYSVVRWTAAANGDVEVAAKFAGLAERATTDVHVLHNGRALFDGLLNINGATNEAVFDKKALVAAGDTVDCVVGSGNGNYGGDTTGLSFTVKSAGNKADATAEFSPDNNPNGAWSYGQLAPGGSPDCSTFACFSRGTPPNRVGSLSNPGSNVWEDVVSDSHWYPRVPHTSDVITSLRTMSANGQPVFFSEYGIGSAVDLYRSVRHYEQLGAADLEDARFLRDKLDRYLADWQRWRLDELHARPEDFFMESLKKMAGQRTLGLNAIRANPDIVAHSLTCAIEEVMCGEGLTTLFREFKPGTIDAMFDAWAPLRWCLFVESVHIRRGDKIHLEAVLANEDMLTPGEYPARLQVVGPKGVRVLDREIKVKISPSDAKHEQAFAQLCFADDVVVDGPTGKYRFLATFLQGAAAAGGETCFYVTDPADMPAVESDVTLWGEDPELARWLTPHGIHARPFAATSSSSGSGAQGETHPEVILASSKPPAPGGEQAFAELIRRVNEGAAVVFLCPEVFAKDNIPTALLPLPNKGKAEPIVGWLYLKDEWAKNHPIFDGLPAGGLMDYDYYREVIPDLVWRDQDPPDEAVAGAIKASQDYSSGLMVSVYRLGKGRMVLNTLKIRENLDGNPAAERLLRNMLRYAGQGKP